MCDRLGRMTGCLETSGILALRSLPPTRRIYEHLLEHLLVTCHFTATLWKELLVWCNGRDINIETLSAVDILFGDWQRKDCFLLFNHYSYRKAVRISLQDQ